MIEIDVYRVNHHRNGIDGAPFFVVDLELHETLEPYRAVVFDETRIAVVSAGWWPADQTVMRPEDIAGPVMAAIHGWMEDNGV